MIRQIRGRVLSLEPTGAIIDIAGFGILVATPTLVGLALGQEAVLATHLAVKQDGMDLYGFIDPLDRDFFEKLLTVSGVGPKTALGILRRSPRQQLENAIAKRDINYLTRVAGLSKKSAEKLAVELSEKMVSASSRAKTKTARSLIRLVALGYTEREARKALGTVAETITGKEARLRAALSGK